MNVGALIGARKITGINGRRTFFTPPLDSGPVQSQI